MRETNKEYELSINELFVLVKVNKYLKYYITSKNKYIT